MKIDEKCRHVCCRSYTVEILDLYTSSDSIPHADNKSDYNITEQSIARDGFSTTFTRKLNTGDSTQDKVLAIEVIMNGVGLTWQINNRF